MSERWRAVRISSEASKAIRRAKNGQIFVSFSRERLSLGVESLCMPGVLASVELCARLIEFSHLCWHWRQICFHSLQHG